METQNLKFRAWDGFNACFYYSEKRESVTKFFELIDHCRKGGNDIKVFSWSGQTVNGRDVYPGDILMLDTNGSLQYSMCVWVKKWGLFALANLPYDYLAFLNGNDVVERDTFLSFPIDKTVQTTMRVCGNIFENPEYLPDNFKEKSNIDEIIIAKEKIYFDISVLTNGYFNNSDTDYDFSEAKQLVTQFFEKTGYMPQYGDIIWANSKPDDNFQEGRFAIIGKDFGLNDDHEIILCVVPEEQFFQQWGYKKL